MESSGWNPIDPYTNRKLVGRQICSILHKLHSERNEKSYGQTKKINKNCIFCYKRESALLCMNCTRKGILKLHLMHK